MTAEPLERDHTEARCTSIIMCSGKYIQEYSAVQGKGISKCQKKKKKDFLYKRTLGAPPKR